MSHDKDGYMSILKKFQSNPELFQPTTKALGKAFVAAFGEPHWWGDASERARMMKIQECINNGSLGDVFVRTDAKGHVSINAIVMLSHTGKPAVAVCDGLGPNLDEYVELKPDEEESGVDRACALA